MTKPFYAEPILNSPYLPPARHHALGDDGQPLEHPPIEGRRSFDRQPGVLLKSLNVTASRKRRMTELPKLDRKNMETAIVMIGKSRAHP